MNVLNGFAAFLKKPYANADMNAVEWFMFLGLILCIFVAWGIILRHMQLAD